MTAICALVALCLFAEGPNNAQPTELPPTTQPLTRPTTGPAASQPHVVKFQPGVRINWTQRQVETDVTVVMREGAIELFACCPKQREYESVVRFDGLPTHLYQAMGLIGLTPGQPDRFDNDGKFIPASGDFVDVEVRYPGLNDQPQQVPIENWLKPAESDARIGRLPWVFAGSRPMEGGKGIASDIEGTVVALVEFSSSLIALPEYHSESNTELWLRPRTERIPPVGTKAQLIIRAAPLRLRVEAAGKLRMGNRAIARDELAQLVKARAKTDPDWRVELTLDKAAGSLEVKSLVQMLRGLGIREKSIEIFAELER